MTSPASTLRLSASLCVVSSACLLGHKPIVQKSRHSSPRKVLSRRHARLHLGRGLLLKLREKVIHPFAVSYRWLRLRPAYLCALHSGRRFSVAGTLRRRNGMHSGMQRREEAKVALYIFFKKTCLFRGLLLLADWLYVVWYTSFPSVTERSSSCYGV